MQKGNKEKGKNLNRERKNKREKGGRGRKKEKRQTTREVKGGGVREREIGRKITIII